MLNRLIKKYREFCERSYRGIDKKEKSSREFPSYSFEIEPFPEELREAINLCEEATHRLELINDDTTPMDYVVGLITEFGYSPADSWAWTLKIHHEGSAELLESSEALAIEVTKYVERDASRNGFPLQVRVSEIKPR